MISVLHSWVYYFPISLCILSGEESVAGNLIILSSAADALVRSHVLNWLRSCSANLSETPKSSVPFDFWRSQNNWCQLVRDGGNSCSKESLFLLCAARVSMRWVRDGEISSGGVCEVSCFHWASLVFLSHCVSLCEALLAKVSHTKSTYKGILTWQWLMMTEGFNTVLKGHRWGGFKWHLSECDCLHTPVNSSLCVLMETTL